MLGEDGHRGWVYYVATSPEMRGEGLGRRLMDAALGHPDLRGVRQFQLYCQEEHVPFYEQWGFTADMGSLCFMRRSGPS